MTLHETNCVCSAKRKIGIGQMSRADRRIPVQRGPALLVRHYKASLLEIFGRREEMHLGFLRV